MWIKMWIRKQWEGSKSMLKVHKKTINYSYNLKLHDHIGPWVMGYNKYKDVVPELKKLPTI